MNFKVKADDPFTTKYVHCKLSNVAIVNLETVDENRYSIEFKAYLSADELPRIVLVDNDSKYFKLCNEVKEQLEALEPWYISGKVGSPMDAVEALKQIDKLVNQ